MPLVLVAVPRVDDVKDSESTSPISCVLDAIRALGYVGQQQQRLTVTESDARLLKSTATRSDDTSARSARG